MNRLVQRLHSRTRARHT